MKLSARAIATEIARRNAPHGSGLGVYRWYVEQTLALMHQLAMLSIGDLSRRRLSTATLLIVVVVVLMTATLYSSRPL